MNETLLPPYPSQFHESEVGLKVVAVILCLKLSVFLQSLHVVRIVPADPDTWGDSI